MPSVVLNTPPAQGKLRSGTWNLGDVFSSWQSDSRSDWCSIQVRSLVGTSSCHYDRGSPAMEWMGALHDRTNWCRLGVSWKKLIRCHPTQLRRCSEREVSERSGANLNADERYITDECFVSWTIRRLVDKFANSR